MLQVCLAEGQQGNWAFQDWSLALRMCHHQDLCYVFIRELHGIHRMKDACPVYGFAQ